MKNCTIPTSFFTALLGLDPKSQLYVLTTCQQLASSDEATIEQFQLPADAPDVLVDFVKRLKRRVRAARRRRERAATRAKAAPEKPQEKTRPSYRVTYTSRQNEIEPPQTFDKAMKMFEAASNYIILAADHADPEQLLSLEEVSNRVSVVISDHCYFLRGRHRITRDYRLCR